MRASQLVLPGATVALLAVILTACGSSTTVDATEFRSCVERDLGTFARPAQHFRTSEDAVAFGLSSRELDGSVSSVEAGGPDAFVYDSGDAASKGASEAEAAGLKVGGEDNVLWVSSLEPISGEFAAALRNCVREAS